MLLNNLVTEYIYIISFIIVINIYFVKYFKNIIKKNNYNYNKILPLNETDYVINVEDNNIKNKDYYIWNINYNYNHKEHIC